MLDTEITLNLLRTAMRQWGAFLETQISIERVLGYDGGSEVRDYVVELAPEFVDCPQNLSAQHVQGLLLRLAQSKERAD
jgi:hypothetical protein